MTAEEIAWLNAQMSPQEKAFFKMDELITKVRPVSHREAGRPVNTATKKVKIYDRGVGKVMYTVEIPVDWQVAQNIYTNPANGKLQNFQLDYTGPEGEWIRVVKPSTYSPQFGQQFHGFWNELLHYSLGNSLQQARIGRLQSSREPLQTSSAQKAIRQFPGNYQGFIQQLSGYINGTPYEGIASIMHTTNQMSGIILATIALSPKGTLGRTLAVQKLMDGRISSNSGEYRSALAQAGSRGLAASAADHNQRMAGLYAKTQRMYQDLSDAQSLSNASFSQDMRSSGLGYNGNSHTANDQFTDYLTDAYTIENPYSGLQERVDNTYQYWFINAAGEKRGTNDPNLDLTSVPGGTWKRASRVGQ